MGYHAAPPVPVPDKYARLTFVLAKFMTVESPAGYAGGDEHRDLAVHTDQEVLGCHRVMAEPALSDLCEK